MENRLSRFQNRSLARFEEKIITPKQMQEVDGGAVPIIVTVLAVVVVSGAVYSISQSSYQIGAYNAQNCQFDCIENTQPGESLHHSYYDPQTHECECHYSNYCPAN